MSIETMLHLGSEGGSLKILRQGRKYALERNEVAACDLLSEEDLIGLPPPVTTSAWGSWRDVAELLSKYPWARMLPRSIHPDRARAILLLRLPHERMNGFCSDDEPRILRQIRQERNDWVNGLWWRSGATALAQDMRARKPLPPRESLTPAQEHQCRILKGALLNLLKNEPGWQAAARGSTYSPIYTRITRVYLSDEPGLIAASEILDPVSPGILCLSYSEYTTLQKLCPDREYKFHLLHRSHIEVEPEGSELERARRLHPLKAGECYWLHKESTMLGRLFGRGFDALWKWDQNEATLLDLDYGSWVS